MNKYNEYLKNYNTNLEEKNSSKSPHQKDWEIILSGYLNEYGFDLKRGNPEKGFLDFYFTENNTKIHIEATAPTEGNGNNRVPKVQSKIGSFEGGIRNDDKILLRYTNCIDQKIEQIKNKNINTDEPIILAINDWEFINHWQFPFDSPMILHVLFGISNPLCNESGDIVYKKRQGIEKPSSKATVKNDYFNDINTPLSGIILSSIQQSELAHSELEQKDFLYIQNPLKKDLTSIFSQNMQLVRWVP